MEPITENLVCSCGKIFQWENLFSTGLFSELMKAIRPKFCEDCAHSQEMERERKNELLAQQQLAEKIERSEKDAMARLREVTPKRYRATDLNHEDFNLVEWKRISKWRASDEVPFIGLVGPSGGCKTRIGFLLLQELVLGTLGVNGERACSFQVATACDFAKAARSQYSKRASQDGMTLGDHSQAYLDRLLTCKVLLLDDLGKATNTATVSAELFAVIDYRHAENLPTIWTANSRPEEVVEGMPRDTASALAGRLLECSEIFLL